MKFALHLTMDGMIRALRTKLHEIGDEAEVVRRDAEERNDTALALLAEEAWRSRREVGDEPRR